MGIRNILVRPLVTEKATSDEVHGNNVYVFEVTLNSEKNDIKEAIESYYNVNVDKVRTMIVRGKSKRSGRHVGKRSNWKKAYVTLASDSTIDIFGEEK
jgi:large subunit ribosomal protein L23|tara:strand:- start:362 stop:655 length:294 start_codon:yes stop_codon:yes gene_type:complete